MNADDLNRRTEETLAREPWLAAELTNVLEAFEPCRECPALNTERGTNLPGQRAMIDVLEELVSLLFPGCHGHGPMPAALVEGMARGRIVTIAATLAGMVERVMAFYCERGICQQCGDCKAFARKSVAAFLRSLADIRTVLHADIDAAYEGDPAARSTMEVVMSYPGLYAVTVHRIAHSLQVLGVPLIPRVMSEHAHSRTGIDIHPGASIGPGFFIDHGTGVVIGETCVIGRHVKLYQGVTLGALSFAKDEHGNLVKGVKRHPDVEDNVIIYAGATILGGDTRIGHDSVIGGNVWLIHSVPPYSKVYNQQPKPLIKAGDTPPA
jgi:serine O-acetyltransferase